MAKGIISDILGSLNELFTLCNEELKDVEKSATELRQDAETFLEESRKERALKRKAEEKQQ